MALNERYAALLRLVQKNLRRFPPADRVLTNDPLESVTQVLVYLRLSKDEGKKLSSIDVQWKGCHYMADQFGWLVLEEFVDEGISGKSFSERPAWDRLALRVRQMAPTELKQTAILFKTPDRFGRDVGEMETTRAGLEEMGIRLRFSDYPFMFPETAEGYMQYIVLAAFATIERKMIVKRTVDALSLRKSKGVKLGKFPSIGFTKDADKRAVPNEVAEQVVALRLAGYSYGAIGQELGIDRMDAFHIASFLRREVERGRLQQADSDAQCKGSDGAGGDLQTARIPAHETKTPASEEVT